MFWVGLVIAVSAAFLGLNFMRSIIQRYLPWVTDKHIERIKFALIIIGAMISSITYFQTQASKIVLQQSLIEAEKQISEGKERLANLQRKVQDRTIPKDEYDIIKTKLAEKRGETIHIVCALGDEEACDFGSKLQGLFEEAGWIVEGGVIERSAYGHVYRDVQVWVKKEKLQEYERLAMYVQSTLASSLNFVKVKKEIALGDPEEGDLEIVIGAKTIQ